MSPVVSAKDETVRLFKSDFLEFFTRVHWSVPLIIFLPVIFYCLWRSAALPGSNGLSLLTGLFAGLFSWSLLEYFLHRFLFHFTPKSVRLKRMFYLIHEVHHEYPQDSLRLVMPPVESIPLAILFWVVLRSILPAGIFFPFYAGLGIGYLAYDMIHYSVHHLPMRNPVAQWLKRHHLKHHFQEPDRGYGVSSPWWDRVFGTSYRNP